MMRVGLETARQMDRRGRSQKRSPSPSILRRFGIRYLPGICQYPYKCTSVVSDVNQGGTADNFTLFVLDRGYSSVGGVFCLPSAERDFCGEV